MFKFVTSIRLGGYVFIGVCSFVCFSAGLREKTLQNATASNSWQLLVSMCLAVQLALKQIVNSLIYVNLATV